MILRAGLFVTMFVTLAAALLACAAGAAQAQSPVDDARAAANALRTAQADLAAATGRGDRVAALTQVVQAYESGLAALRDGLRRAAIRQRSLEGDLAARSDEVARLLAVLQNMGRAPAPILLLHPSGPVGTARSGMMLADVTPALQVEVDRLRAQLDELAGLQTVQTEAEDILSVGLRGVQTARADLAQAISARTDLPQRFVADPVQVAIIAASADTLDDFAQSLTDAQGPLQGAITGPDARSLMGALPLPVEGQVLRDFGQADAAGITRPGWVVATRPRALVTTPVSATIRYAGPLTDYGQVVILEPAADVMWVLAGLDAAFGTAGAVIPAGTPVGLMGGTSPNVQDILTETTQGSAGQRTQTLYLEVRDGQDAVNPCDMVRIAAVSRHHNDGAYTMRPKLRWN